MAKLVPNRTKTKLESIRKLPCLNEGVMYKHSLNSNAIQLH